MKRTVTIVSCNGMTVSDGDGTLASTIDSLVNAATLRIDFYNISVPVIVMRHGNCRMDTFTYGQISEIIKWDHHSMSAFGTIIKPLWHLIRKAQDQVHHLSARFIYGNISESYAARDAEHANDDGASSDVKLLAPSHFNRKVLQDYLQCSFHQPDNEPPG